MQRDVGNGSRRNARFAHASEKPIRESLVAWRRITDVESNERPRWQSVEQEGRVRALAASHRKRTGWPGDDNERYPEYRAVQAPPRSWLDLTLSSRLVIWNRFVDDAEIYTRFRFAGQMLWAGFGAAAIRLLRHEQIPRECPAGSHCVFAYRQTVSADQEIYGRALAAPLCRLSARITRAPFRRACR
jgi:hypothetical protein